MARASVAKSGGNSRIRVVLVEAELADGELTQLIPALQNALRGSTSAAVQRIAPPNKTITPEPQDAELEDEVEEEAATEAAPAVPRANGVRKPAPTPEVLELDLTTDVSLADYAQKANPKSHLKRYLVIAAWFKDHRKTDAITAAHAYTAYRALKWPLTVPDFAQPLRDLKFKKFFTQPEKGSYAINHLGLAEVEALMRGGD